MSSQSTQYNSIQSAYDEVTKGTPLILSRVQVRQILLPIIKGASVLDLACGSGFHSRNFLAMGAQNVVGVDISSGMLEEARRLSADQGDRITFIEADGSKPVKFPGGPFDIAFGGWFLNYAPDRKTMVQFYRTILVNLKPGGMFLGITPPATDDPKALYELEQKLRPLEMRSALYTTINHPVEDGYSVHRHMINKAGTVDFDTFHLRQDVWESAAKEAGFSSAPKWIKNDMPEDFMESPTKYGEADNGGATPEEISTYDKVALYSILQLTN